MQLDSRKHVSGKSGAIHPIGECLDNRNPTGSQDWRDFPLHHFFESRNLG